LSPVDSDAGAFQGEEPLDVRPVLKYHNATSDASGFDFDICSLGRVLEYSDVTSDGGVADVELLNVPALLKYHNGPIMTVP